MSRSLCHLCSRHADGIEVDYDLGAPICSGCRLEHVILCDQFAPWSDLRERTPDEPPWVWEGYVAKGALTLVSGKPKAGKSTFVTALAQACDSEAASFVGRYLNGGPVVYVSEEGAGTFAAKLPPSSLSYAITRDAAWPKPSWPAIVAAAVSVAERIDAALLVIDSLAFWAAFKEGQEKDAGAAQATMDALSRATTAGFAVLVVHHQRKSGGSEGDAVRGSGAILGAVDLSLEVERLEDSAPASQRRLVAVGRWPGTPPVLVVDRETTGTWRLVGQTESRQGAEAMGWRGRVLAAMPVGSSATEAELERALGADKRKFGATLRELVNTGQVTRTGAGKRGNPYRYEKASPKVSQREDSIHAERVSVPLGRTPSAMNGQVSLGQEGTPLGSGRARSATNGSAT